MLTCNIRLMNMPFREAVITKKKLIILLVQEWLYTFCQRIQVISIIKKGFNYIQSKFILIFFVNIFCIFYSSFITAHGVMRIKWNDYYLLDFRILFFESIERVFR